MSISDNQYVNFSEKHELDYQLRKVEKKRTEVNRVELCKMGKELKEELKKTILKHGEFHKYVTKNKHRLA